MGWGRALITAAVATSSIGLGVPAVASAETLKLTTPLSESIGEPLTITVSGVADGSHRLYVYADEERSGCAANPAEESHEAGRLVVLSEVDGELLPSGAFSRTYVHTYRYQLPVFCAYLDDTPSDTADAVATGPDPVREYLEHEEPAEPTGTRVGTLPGAIEPAPVNPQLEREFYERLTREQAERIRAQEAKSQVQVQPPPAQCVVPSLRGSSLNAAKRVLRRAKCKLGRVSRPARAAHGALLVMRQSQPRGRKLPAGTPVAVTLAARRR